VIAVQYIEETKAYYSHPAFSVLCTRWNMKYPWLSWNQYGISIYVEELGVWKYCGAWCLSYCGDTKCIATNGKE